MENRVIFLRNSNIHQVQTKASPQISPNSYEFVFITFKDTDVKISEENITVRAKEQTLSKNSEENHKDKEKLKSSKSSLRREKKSLSLKQKSKGQLKSKSQKHSFEDTGELNNSSQLLSNFTDFVEVLNKHNQASREQALSSTICQESDQSDVALEKKSVMDKLSENEQLLLHEEEGDVKYQEASEDRNRCTKNVNKHDLQQTNEQKREILDKSKNLDINEEHISEKKPLILNQVDKKKDKTQDKLIRIKTVSLHEDEAAARFQQTAEDNREDTLDKDQEVAKENDQLNSTILKQKDRVTESISSSLSCDDERSVKFKKIIGNDEKVSKENAQLNSMILKLKDRITQTKDLLSTEEDVTSEFQERSGDDNLFEKTENKFASNLIERPRRHSEQPHNSQNLYVINENETNENLALPPKILKKNSNKAVDTKEDKEETNEIFEDNENKDIKNKSANENNVDVTELTTEASRIETVKSHDCVKNLAVTLKYISDKNCLLSSSSFNENRNNTKVTKIKKILFSEEKKESRLQEESEDNREDVSKKDYKRTDLNYTELPRSDGENDLEEDCPLSSIVLKTSELNEKQITDTSVNQIENKEELKNSGDYSKKVELDEDGLEHHHERQRNSSEICEANDSSTTFEYNNGFSTKNEIFLNKTATEEKKLAINKESESKHKKEIFEGPMIVRSKKRRRSYDCIQDQKNNKKEKIELVETKKMSLNKVNTVLDKSETRGETFNNSEILSVREKPKTPQKLLFEQENQEEMKKRTQNIEQNKNEDIVQTSKECIYTEDKNDKHMELAETETSLGTQYEIKENEADVVKFSELVNRKKNNGTVRSKKARKMSLRSDTHSKFSTNYLIDETDKNVFETNISEHLKQSNEKDDSTTKSKMTVNIISNQLLNPLQKQIAEETINNVVEGKDENDTVDSDKETRSEKRKEKTRLTQKRIRDYFSKNRKKSANKQDLTIEELEKDRSVSSHYSFQNVDSTSEESLNQSTNEQRGDDYLRDKLINKITHSIDKIIHENEHIAVSHEVNVNVDIKKVNSIDSTEEEVVVSYKRCLNRTSNEVLNTIKENNMEDNSISESSFERTSEHVKQRQGNADETHFDDNVQHGEEKDEEQDPMTNMIEKLDGLKIIIPWSLAPLHQVKVITGCLTNEQKQEMRDRGVTIKTGKFTKWEDESIKSNWSEFCTQHDLPVEPSPLLNFSHLKGINFPWEERLNFVRFLAHGLDNRTLHSVYSRFKKLKTETKTGRFTEKEDQIIIKYMKNTANHKQYAHLARILNRERIAVYRRHKILTSKDKVTKLKWNEKKVTEFMKHLFKVTNCNCTEDLRERELTTEEWNKLSEKMDIPNKQLRRVWFSKIYPRLFIENTMKTNEVKKKLIKILLDKEDEDWKLLNWDEIAEEFTGLTSQYLYFMFKAAVRYHVPKQQQNDLKECLKHLRIKYLGRDKTNREISKLDLDESYLISSGESDESI